MMFEDTISIPRRRMTPEDVLAALADFHRHEVECDPEADPRAKIAFDVTIKQWRSACDLVSWRPLGQFLNVRFGTLLAGAANLGTWIAAKSKPASVQFGNLQTFRDLCEVLARNNPAE